MLKKSAPSTGLFCVGIQKGTGFAHRFFSTYEEAHDFAIVKDQDGETVYMGQATFKTGESRKGVNVQSVRAFWLDIDCGEGKPYADQKAGAAAIKDFCVESGLPVPAVVRSGGGLYAYWFLDQDISPIQWKTVADYLKAVLAAYNLDADPSRTADLASVLRPVGSTNRKIAGFDRPVGQIKDAEPIKFLDFVKMLTEAGKKRKVEKKTVGTSRPALPANEQFRIHDTTPIDADQIASRCPQMWSIKTSKGDVAEPLWYAAVGLLRYASDPNVVFEWSSGHPEYSVEATQRKVDQHESAGIGPTTCAHFASCNPDGCLGCKAKVKSPIQLGRPDPIPLAVSPDQEDCYVAPPEGFTRSDDGLWYRDDEVNVRFYDRDLYPVRVAHDEGLGYETLTLRHHSLHDGINDFTIRTSTIHDPKALMQALTDNHVLVCGKQEKNIMAGYIESYTQRLQRNRKLIRLMSQMGWKEIGGEAAFVLGKRIYHQNGKVDEADLAANVPTVAAAFHSAGEVGPWVEATEILDKPGMEPYAFALLAGAFGAPVFKFTGFEGAMISLVGDSGIGKTLVTRWAQSAYGDQSKLMMLRDDTKNSLISRLGLYGSLPLTIDEITNIDSSDLSDLVYRITQGRDKARLTRSAVERANINHWNTIALVSTNASLVDKLSSFKSDATAEINRVLEYYVMPNPHFGREVATGVYRTIEANYGKVGEEYIKYIVQNVDKHQVNIDKLATMIDSDGNLTPDERYWSALIASAIYGGHVAKKLGLIRFDVGRVMQWAVSKAKVSHTTKVDSKSSAADLLGMFLDEHQNNRLVVRLDGRVGVVLQEPRGALAYRVEQDNPNTYISRSCIRKWCDRNNHAYSAMRDELEAAKVLVNPSLRKSLGANTIIEGSAQPCWVVNMHSPSLGYIGIAYQSEIEGIKRKAKG